MLRSLVGSEMCIRDRPRADQARPLRQGQPGGKAGRPGDNALGAARKPRACLLYTSDAADDLHCVDLGGRRIIKKKNTIDMKHS